MRPLILSLCASALIAAPPAVGFELTLTADEQASCNEEGGCIVISRERVKGLMLKAYGMGKDSCGGPKLET